MTKDSRRRSPSLRRLRSRSFSPPRRRYDSRSPSPDNMRSVRDISRSRSRSRSRSPLRRSHSPEDVKMRDDAPEPKEEVGTSH